MPEMEILILFATASLQARIALSSPEYLACGLPKSILDAAWADAHNMLEAMPEELRKGGIE